ncbi:hypothetical protein K3495_g2211 [Podosphaera aphanis]|nr:hypothetical protein K3495_g2211 [Podosphaera aphanis]
MSNHSINGPYQKLTISSTAEETNCHGAFTGGGGEVTKHFGSPLPRSYTPRFIKTFARRSLVECGNSNDLFSPKPPTPCHMAQLQPSDIGFRYMENNRSQLYSHPAEAALKPASSPSALTFSESLLSEANNPQSPTFREEQMLEKQEKFTEKEQAKDLKVKIRVRMAKFVLRGVSFGCSLIVLTLVSTSFTIFNASKHLPARNHLPPWASGTKIWPQVLVLVTSCISLASCIYVFWNYFRGGHRRAEKVAIYYTLLAVAFFIMSSVMWGIAAGVLQGTRSSSLNKDMWGWSCVDNKRRQLFSEKIDYALVCRMQNWTLLCCIIETVLESITILLYGVVFYRYHSKQRLRKSMDIRDRARSDLYLAQVQSQLSPNPLLTPYLQQPSSPQAVYQKQPTTAVVNTSTTRFIEVRPTSAVTAKPFTLQPPPAKNVSVTHGDHESVKSTSVTYLPGHTFQHAIAAPGERAYEVVPIPSPYKKPMALFSPLGKYVS